MAIAACKKDRASADEQAELTVERGSNAHLAGAIVDAYKCNTADWVGNCSQQGQHLSTATTNAAGKAFSAKSLGAQTFVIKKENYWDVEMVNLWLNPFSLVPAATLKVHFIRTKQYPANNQLYVRERISPSALYRSRARGLPADATIYPKGLGGEMNGVDWQVGTRPEPPFTSTQLVMIPKFDMAAFPINY